MTVDTDTMISITKEKAASTDDLIAISERLIQQNMETYKELAK